MKKLFTLLSMIVMLLISFSASAQENLFISEFSDPMDDYSGRFVELFNAGTELIDFNTSLFYLSRQSNGGTGWGDVQLAGVIAPGETFVIGGSNFENLYGFTPDLESGILIGNGDDAYFLFKNGDHQSGTIHDVFGEIDVDGTGEAWEYTDSRVLRAGGIFSPNSAWLLTEWEIESANYSDCNPGFHDPTINGNNDPIPVLKSFTVSNDTTVLGLTADVNISVSLLKAEDNIISYQFILLYDSLLLEYANADISGTLVDGGSLAVNSNVQGKLTISYMTSQSLVGLGSIINLHFNAIATGTSALELSNAWLNNFPLDSLADGEVIIKPATPPTANISYDDTINRFMDTLEIRANFSELMDEANEVHLILHGAIELADATMTRLSPMEYLYKLSIPKTEGDVYVRLSNGTNLWGIETDSLPIFGDAFSIKQFLAGDIDDDGSILAYDAALALQYSVGIDPIPDADPYPWEPWRDSTANVDGIGDITANDAALILKYSAGIFSTFSSETKKAVSYADLSIKIIENNLVFHSHGDLIGLNLFAINDKNLLAAPQSLGGDYLWAFNNTEENYNLGMCTIESPADGTAIFKIPFTGGGNIKFKLLINNEARLLNVTLPTGLRSLKMDDLSVYPNPAKDQIFVKLASISIYDDLKLRVINQKGGIEYETMVVDQVSILDTSDWSGNIFYIQVINSVGKGLIGKEILLR